MPAIDRSDLHRWAWAFGAFHAALLVLVLVLAVYRLGNLGGALKNAGTIPGLALYLALWASTWWTATRALAGMVSRSVGSVLGAGALWGGVNGAIFFVVLFLGALSVVAARNGLALPSITVLFVILLEAAFGALPAFAIGALVGVLFAVLDLFLLALTGALVGRDVTSSA